MLSTPTTRLGKMQKIKQNHDSLHNHAASK